MIEFILIKVFIDSIKIIFFVSVLMDDYLTSFLIFTATIVLVTYSFLKLQYRYWKQRNVPYLEPKFPFGNLKGFPKGIGIGKISYDFYHEFKKTGSKLGGKCLELCYKPCYNLAQMFRKIMHTQTLV